MRKSLIGAVSLFVLLWTGDPQSVSAQLMPCATPTVKVAACVAGAPLRTSGRLLFIENAAQPVDLSVEAVGTQLTAAAGNIGPTTTAGGRLAARWTPSSDRLVQFIQTDAGAVAAIAVLLPALQLTSVRDGLNDRAATARIELAGLGSADVAIDVSTDAPVARFTPVAGSIIGITGALRLDDSSNSLSITAKLPGTSERTMLVSVAPSGITATAGPGGGTFGIAGIDFDASTLRFSTRFENGRPAIALDGASSATALLGKDVALNLPLVARDGKLMLGCPKVTVGADKPLFAVDAGILNGLGVALHSITPACDGESLSSLAIDAAISLGNLTLPANTLVYMRLTLQPNQTAAVSFVDVAGQRLASPPSLSLAPQASVKFGSVALRLSQLAFDPQPKTAALRLRPKLELMVGSIDVLKAASDDFALDLMPQDSSEKVHITCVRKPAEQAIPLPLPFRGTATLRPVCEHDDGTGTLQGIHSGPIALAVDLGAGDSALDVTVPGFTAQKGRAVKFDLENAGGIAKLRTVPLKFAGMTGSVDVTARYDTVADDVVLDAAGALDMGGPFDKTTLTLSKFAYGLHQRTIVPPALAFVGGSVRIMGFAATTCEKGIIYENSILSACVGLSLPVHFKQRVTQFDLSKADPADASAVSVHDADAPQLQIHATRAASGTFSATVSFTNNPRIACKDSEHRAEDIGVKYGAHFGLFDGCIRQFAIKRGALSAIDSAVCSSTEGTNIAAAWTLHHPDDIAAFAAAKFASFGGPVRAGPAVALSEPVPLDSNTTGDGYMIVCGDVHFDRFLPPANYAVLEAAFTERAFVGAARLNDVAVNVLGGTVKVTKIRIAMTERERSVHSESTISVGNGPQGYPISFTDLGFRFRRDAVDDTKWKFEPIVVVDKSRTIFDNVPRLVQDFVAMWAARGFRFRL
ncbi:MAG TPA: hypothetical protein VGC72_04575 [Candidatus Elarobacter sp.]|jgi:hypothetical protein